MSWTLTDCCASTFKRVFRENLRSKKKLAVGKTVVLPGDIFWEDGRRRPSRPVHSHRMLQFFPSGNNPIISLKGLKRGGLTIMVKAKTSDIIEVANSQQLRSLKPEPEASSLEYGCIMKDLKTEGSHFAAEVLAKIANNGQLDFGKFEL